MILGGVLMTFLVNVLLSYAGHWWVDTFYNADAAVESRNRALAEDLQRYVTQNHVSSTDFAGIVAWFDSGIDADLIIYGDDGGAVEAGSWGYDRLTESEVENSEPTDWGYSTYTIDFDSGSRRVAIADYSDLRMGQRVKLSTMVISFLVFVGSLLLYTRRITRLLQDFSKDVTAVSRGEAEHVDEKRGFSELSALAGDVNHMHDVILQRTRTSQNAMQANRELIAALSHDIRNPLTSLIGYLDLLGMESDTLTETQKRYLAGSAEKADRIRALTDEMFRYFLVFSDGKLPVHMEPYNAQILLEQMLGEHAIELESLGYTVQSDPLQTPCRVETDITMLSRVLENVFSNIRKYADPAKPVRLAARARDGQLHVMANNALNTVPSHSVESNRVGLRTCAAIMALLNGTFRAEEDHGWFIVEFTLPLLPEM